MEELDLTDIDLVTISTKDFNRKLKNFRIGKGSDREAMLKERRRTLKNR
jgi:hypothetical protein